MGSRTRLAAVVVALGAAVLAPAAQAVAPPKVTWMPSRAGNYTSANRPPSSIRWIVIHTTEGSFWGAVQWLRNPRARASAHYVVSQGGQIVQLVRDSDIAWHAGNYAINRSSIGIEHEGYAYRAGSITEAEYRASAQLSAWLARRSLMPIDRKHFIGHGEVPDPNNPHKHGGFSHHTDPGPHWNWGRYLSYVRSYARGAKPPRYVGAKPAVPRQQPLRAAPVKVAPVSKQSVGALKVSSVGFANGQTVSGFVGWTATTAGAKVQRVDFLVDGRLRSSDTSPPFTFGGGARWDTTRETNGPHVLTVRVVSQGGKVAGASVRVRVVNTPFQIVSQLENGTTLSGVTDWEATAVGGEAERVEFLVDGRVRHTDGDAPFAWRWDTRKEANGPHALTLRGIAEDGRVATVNVGVSVANEAPPPPKAPPFAIASQSLRDGETVRGAVRWEANVEGDGVASVEFWIDGVLRWTERTKPYRFNGDSGRWDTAAETPGPHALAIRAVHKDGRSASAGVTVTVAPAVAPPSAPSATSTAPPPPPPPPLRVATASIDPGQVVRGTVRWRAEGDGLARVEYVVDGRVRHRASGEPWEFEWDTREYTNGAHTLSLRATGKDGKRRDSPSFTVVVDNPLPPLRVTLEGVPGGPARGRVRLQATVDAPKVVAKVEFLVDGAVRHVERSAPYDFDWDTARERDGDHAVVARAIATDGRVEAASATVRTANAPPPPTVTLAVPPGPLAGRVRLEAKVEGKPERVEFLVDGKLRHTERSAPYEFEWDTRSETDGAHVVVARAVAGGVSAEARGEAVVRNAKLAVTLAGVAPGATVGGEVAVEARVEGTAERVEFLVDGVLRRTDTSAPYTFAWATAAERDGARVLVARAVAADGRTAEAEARVEVRNAAAKPPAALEVSLPALASPLAGKVRVEAKVTGTAARVEFLVDGKLRHTERTTPYEFDWDTLADADGPHVLVARAVAADGRTAEAEARVEVRNAAAKPPAALEVSLPALASPLAGKVRVEAKVTGTAARVEFLVDGKLRHTERTAPYEFDWDTLADADGPHVLAARAVRADGSSVTAEASVTVANGAAPVLTVTGITDGATVHGTVEISVTAEGATLRRVELRVDGRRRLVDREALFMLTWDTARETPGARTVVVRATTSSGRVLTATFAVTVAAP